MYVLLLRNDPQKFLDILLIIIFIRCVDHNQNRRGKGAFFLGLADEMMSLFVELLVNNVTNGLRDGITESF